MRTTPFALTLLAVTLTIVPVSSSIASVVPGVALRTVEPSGQDGCLSAVPDDADAAVAVLADGCPIPPGCHLLLAAGPDQDGFWRSARCDEDPAALLL
jgi:hypothetical protein